MRKAVVLMLVLVVLLVIATQAMAKDVTIVYKSSYGQVVINVPDPANEVPDGVAKPYTHFTRFMSIHGFVRWYVWQTRHYWMN